jgi:hypothetical protein
MNQHPSRDIAGHVAPMQPTPRSVEIAPIEVPGGERAVAPQLSIERVDIGLERLSPARIAEIRGRLGNGMYDSAQLIDALALRLVESGDLHG